VRPAARGPGRRGVPVTPGPGCGRSATTDEDPGRSPELGYALADWIETYLIHGPGDVQGQEIELDPEILTVHRLLLRDRRPGPAPLDEAVLSRAKGRAKSEYAGMLVVAEALAPVRFDHWAEAGEVSDWGYEYEKGEPVGRPVTYPFIRCLATEETQAGNTYANVTYMLEHSEALAEDYPGVDIGNDWQTSTRVFLPGGGEIRPSTASSAAKDGGKESFSVADETHLYVLPELRDMYETVQRNTMKRKPPSRGSSRRRPCTRSARTRIAERTHRDAKAHKAPRLHFDHVRPRSADRGRRVRRPGAAQARADPGVRAGGVVDGPRPHGGPGAQAVPGPGEVPPVLPEPAGVDVGDVAGPAHLGAVRAAAGGRARRAITLGFDGSDHDDCTAITACASATATCSRRGSKTAAR
jgi:hypothetical protein